MTRWGIIGPGSIAGNFATGLASLDDAKLVAVASRDQGRAAAFGKRFGVAEDGCVAGYDNLLARQDVDAVYVSTIHTLHAQLTIDALNAGKHVVVEKPAALNVAELQAMQGKAAEAGLFLLEAYMYRFHPQIARVRELIASGVIGEVVHVEAVFGFNVAEDASSRLFDPGQAGGGIYDIGGYPLSFARYVAGCAIDRPFADPVSVRGVGQLTGSGADGSAHALLKFESGMTATCTCAVSHTFGEHVRVHGSLGQIFLPDPWCPGKEKAPSDSEVHVITAGGTEVIPVAEPGMLYALEAAAAGRAIAAGEVEAAQMSWADSLGNMQAMDDWRDEVGYAPPAERLETSRPLVGLRPAAQVLSVGIDGIPVPVSRLALGLDNQLRDSDCAVICDAWMEAGGNTFDSAWMYADGKIEAIFGRWVKSRGVANDIVMIVKGAHTPMCDPENLEIQFYESLERLGLDRADIYCMHRDNLRWPVGEFIDVMDAIAAKGHIRVPGVSNWTLARLREANDWAQANGKRKIGALSNNLSLAAMPRQFWPGIEGANDPAMLAYLKEEGIAHFSWSSQARGYFLPAATRQSLDLPPGTGPEDCFGSPENEERRKRAEQLAEAKQVTANNIALAWVLSQPFSSHALIGPRRPAEIASSMPALDIKLTEAEIAWLNLEADSLG